MFLLPPPSILALMFLGCLNLMKALFEFELAEDARLFELTVEDKFFCYKESPYLS